MQIVINHISIVGNNESGKTTILKGVNIISKLCCGYKLKDSEISEIKPNIDYFTGEIKMSAELSFNKNDVNENILNTINNENTINIRFFFFYRKGVFWNKKQIFISMEQK